MNTTLLVLATTLLAFAPPALGHGGWTHCGTDDVEVVDQYYVLVTAQGSVWIYQESNGIAHLQRGGGASSVLPDDVSICVESLDADSDAFIA